METTDLKVYILKSSSYEETEIVEVFDSRESAQKYCKSMGYELDARGMGWSYHVEEYAVKTVR